MKNGIIETAEDMQKIRNIEQLQNKLDIAVKALEGIRNVWENNPNMFSNIARVANRKAKQALKEIEVIDMVGTLISLAKEEQ